MVLTEHGASLWAVCRQCERLGGRSLRAGWIAALFWVLVPIVVLFGLIEALERAFR